MSGSKLVNTKKRCSSYRSSRLCPHGEGERAGVFCALHFLGVYSVISAVLAVGGCSLNPAVHSRLAQLCSTHFSGLEGTVVKDFKLHKVFTIVSTGLLSPTGDTGNIFPATDRERKCSFHEFAQNHKSQKIQDYPEVLRIKEKMKSGGSSFKVFKKVPDSCENGALSPYGVYQMIQLGEYLSSSYFPKLVSLKERSLCEECIQVEGEETLFQSLSALLYGLLNEKQFLLTRIKKASRNFQELLKEKSVCAEYSDIEYFVKPAYEKEHALFKESEKRYEFNSALESLFGSETPSKKILSYLTNNLCYSYLEDQDETVLWNNLAGDSLSMDALFNTSDQHNLYLSSSPVFKTYAEKRSVAFYRLMKNFFSSGKYPNEKARAGLGSDLSVVSVDDLLMFSLLTSMGFSVSKHISPASRLIFESFVFSPKGSQFLKSHPSTSLISAVRPPSLSEILRMKAPPPPNLDHKLRGSTEPSFQGKLRVEPDSILIGGKSPLVALQQSKKYIRVIYNGEVITPLLPACENDSLIGLGLCSWASIENFMEKVKDFVYKSVREEL